MAESRCQKCGEPVPTLWTYCEPCRLEVAVENRHEALEELSWRYELEENRRRR